MGMTDTGGADVSPGTIDRMGFLVLNMLDWSWQIRIRIRCRFGLIELQQQSFDLLHLSFRPGDDDRVGPRIRDDLQRASVVDLLQDLGGISGLSVLEGEDLHACHLFRGGLQSAFDRLDASIQFSNQRLKPGGSSVFWEPFSFRAASFFSTNSDRTP